MGKSKGVAMSCMYIYGDVNYSGEAAFQILHVLSFEPVMMESPS
jgi:hypothetical protein